MSSPAEPGAPQAQPEPAEARSRRSRSRRPARRSNPSRHERHERHERHAAARAARRAAMPPIAYPPELPVSQLKDEIARAIEDHQVVIVAGETGSGKTTQIPKICLELGRGRGRPDRPHPAAPAGRPDGGRADRRGTGQPARRDGRLPGAVHRRVRRRHAGQAHDRRHPAHRAGPRPHAQPLRHADHRRGARAQPEHRLHPRLPPAAAAAAARPQAHHHLGHHRPGALRRGLRRRAHHRGVRPHLPGRGPLPAGRREDSDQGQAISDAIDELSAEGPGDILVFLSGEREIRDTADLLGRPGPARRAPAVLPAVGRRAAPGVRAPSGLLADPPGRPGHQRGRDLADRARHPLRHRPRHRADLPLQPPDQGAAAAHRADLAGLGQPAPGPLRPDRGRDLHPAVLRGGLPGAPGVHRAGDPAHQPGLGHLADGGASAWATCRSSRSSTRPTRATSPTAWPCWPSSTRSPTAGSPGWAASWPGSRSTPGWAG